MNHLGLYPIMERNNEAAAHITRKEYGEGMEKLEGALRLLQSHLVEMSKGSRGGDIYSNTIGSEVCSLDEWMLPALEALHVDDCGSSGFFVYRKPLFVPRLHLCRAKSADECLRVQNARPTQAQASLLVAMLFNFGLACQLWYLDTHEGRTKDLSLPLLQKASQMYDIAIATLRRMTASNRVRTVSVNIHFFRAAMNNLAISEQTRYMIAAAASSSSSHHIPSNKGFDRLRELLLQQPPKSDDAPEATLWNCYLANILRVTNSIFHPNYCAPAC